MTWFLILLAIVAIIGITIYNSLVKMRTQAQGAWADIDVQLKRRWDLIPNLVETVKGYASHEKDTLEAVIGSLLLGRVARLDTRFGRLRDVIGYLGYGEPGIVPPVWEDGRTHEENVVAKLEFERVSQILNDEERHCFRQTGDVRGNIRYLEGFRQLCAAGLVLHHLNHEFSLTDAGFEVAAHVDAEPEAWSFPPFTFAKGDGYYYEPTVAQAIRVLMVLGGTAAGIGIAMTSSGWPSVSVPVLSTTIVSTFSKPSSASAFLIRMPFCAPLPVPTMIDIGVARPSAQGQAMISTATAFTIAYAIAGCGPTRPQMMNVMMAAMTTAGTNQPATTSATRWIGARLRCASATMWTICANRVSLPTRSASITRLPVPLTVAIFRTK